MGELEEAIRLKRTLMARLREEIDILEKAQSLIDQRTPIPIEPRLLGKRSGKNKSSRRGKISPKSDVGMAITILKERGSPMHADEIIEQLKKRGKIAQKYSLVSSLAKLAKKGLVFYRANQPNTFGLLEWEGAKAVAQS